MAEIGAVAVIIEPDPLKPGEQIRLGLGLGRDALTGQPTDRHAIRISSDTAVLLVLTASHAIRFLDVRVKPASWRAHGTAATTTP